MAINTTHPPRRVKILIGSYAIDAIRQEGLTGRQVMKAAAREYLRAVQAGTSEDGYRRPVYFYANDEIVIEAMRHAGSAHVPFARAIGAAIERTWGPD